MRPQLSGHRKDLQAEANAHRRILEALRSGDREAARETTKDHFRGSHSWILAAKKNVAIPHRESSL